MYLAYLATAALDRLADPIQETENTPEEIYKKQMVVVFGLTGVFFPIVKSRDPTDRPIMAGCFITDSPLQDYVYQECEGFPYGMCDVDFGKTSWAFLASYARPHESKKYYFHLVSPVPTTDNSFQMGVASFFTGNSSPAYAYSGGVQPDGKILTPTPEILVGKAQASNNANKVLVTGQVADMNPIVQGARNEGVPLNPQNFRRTPTMNFLFSVAPVQATELAAAVTGLAEAKSQLRDLQAQMHGKKGQDMGDLQDRVDDLSKVARVLKLPGQTKTFMDRLQTSLRYSKNLEEKKRDLARSKNIRDKEKRERTVASLEKQIYDIQENMSKLFDDERFLVAAMVRPMITLADSTFTTAMGDQLRQELSRAGSELPEYIRALMEVVRRIGEDRVQEINNSFDPGKKLEDMDVEVLFHYLKEMFGIQPWPSENELVQFSIEKRPGLAFTNVQPEKDQTSTKLSQQDIRKQKLKELQDAAIASGVRGSAASRPQLSTPTTTFLSSTKAPQKTEPATTWKPSWF